MLNKKHLSNLSKFKKANALAFSEYCRIQGSFATVADLDIFYSVEHGIKDVTPAIVPTAELVKIAQKYNIESIHGRGGLADIITDAGTFTLDNLDAEQWPDMPVMAYAQRQVIDPALFSDMFPYISNDELRPSMTGIYFGLDICATNGHILKWRDNPHFKDGYSEFIMPRKVAELLKADEYRHYYADEYCNIQGNHETIVYKRINETYPKYRNVIPKNNNRGVIIRKKDALKAIEAAKIVSNTVSKRIKLCINGNVNLYAEDIDLKKQYASPAIGYSMDIEKEEELFEIGFNWGYLERAIKDGPDQSSVKMSTANRAAIFNGDTLVMPVMLH